MRKPDFDPYTVLGVARNATSDEIKAAYRALVAKYHPDLHQGNPLADLAAARLAELNAAYEILSDPERRAAYDGGQRAWPRPAGSPWPGMSGGAGRRRTAWPYVIGLLFLAPLLIRLVVSLVRLLVRAIGVGAESFAAARGTPLMLAAVVLVGAGIFLLVRRRRRR